MGAHLLKKATAQSSERGHSPQLLCGQGSAAVGPSHAARLWHLPHPGQRLPIHVSVPAWGRPSFKSKLLLGPRPKLCRGSMRQSTGQDSFQAVAWLLLIPSFRQMKAVKPGSPLGSPGAVRRERGSIHAYGPSRGRGSCSCPGPGSLPARPFVPLHTAQGSEKLCSLPYGRGKGPASEQPFSGHCPKRKGICPSLLRLGLGAEAGPAGEAWPFSSLPCPARPCPSLPVPVQVLRRPTPAGGGHGRAGPVGRGGGSPARRRLQRGSRLTQHPMLWEKAAPSSARDRQALSSLAPSPPFPSSPSPPLLLP